MPVGEESLADRAHRYVADGSVPTFEVGMRKARAIDAAAEAYLDAKIRIETDSAIAAAQRNVPAAAGTASEDETETIQQKDPVMTSIQHTPDSSQIVAPIRPIYGPNTDPQRWVELQSWLLEHAHELRGGRYDPIQFLHSLDPEERASWHETCVLGRPQTDVLRDVEYPYPPMTVGPAWATYRQPASVSSKGDLPLVVWESTLVDSAAVQVFRTRVDVYDPESGELREWEPERAQIHIAGEAIETYAREVDFTRKSDDLRAIAAALVSAADAWDAAR